MNAVDEEKLKEYEKLKDKARKIERSAPLIFALCFVLLVVFLILSERIWKYLFYIALGLFVIFTAIILTLIFSLNKKLKLYEKKLNDVLIANTEKTEDNNEKTGKKQ